MKDTLFFTRGIDTIPPKKNVLADTLYNLFVKLPSCVRTSTCDAVILLSSPWNPPTRKSTVDTMSVGYALVKPRRWLPPYRATPSSVVRLLPIFPPRTYMADEPSPPMDTPGNVWMYLIASASPVAATIVQIAGSSTIRVPASLFAIRSASTRAARSVSWTAPS